MTAHDAVEDLRLALALLAQIGVDAELTVDTLAQRLGTDRQEIERLVGLIGLSGLPPYTPDALVEIEVSANRIGLRSGPADALLAPPSLTLAETEALHGALSLIGSQLGREAESALASVCEKIDASLAGAATPPESERLLGAAMTGADADLVDTLLKAIAKRHSVDIDHYSSSAERVTKRRVDPYRLQDRGGVWYLLARCHSADEARVFRVDRIRSASWTAETFEPPPPEELERWAGVPFASVPKVKQGRLRARGMAARRLAERWPEYVEKRQAAARTTNPRRSKRSDPASGITLAVPYRDERWLIHEILPYLDEVTVLGPPTLAEAYRDLLLRMAEIYRLPTP